MKERSAVAPTALRPSVLRYRWSSSRMEVQLMAWILQPDFVRCRMTSALPEMVHDGVPSPSSFRAALPLVIKPYGSPANGVDPATALRALQDDVCFA